jgi:hypothetical protein
MTFLGSCLLPFLQSHATASAVFISATSRPEPDERN